MAEEADSHFITFEEAVNLTASFLGGLVQCQHSHVIYDRLLECIKPISKGNFNKAFSKTIEKAMFDDDTALRFYLLMYSVSLRVKDSVFDTTECTQLLATQYESFVTSELTKSDDEEDDEEDFESDDSDASDESDD
jgi:hypothetical protein